MVTALLWDQIIDSQLKQAIAELATRPHLPRVASVRFQTGTDSTGDPAVWIWLVLERGTPSQLMSFEKLNEMANHVRRYFYQPQASSAPQLLPSAPAPHFSPTVIPYVYFEREEERP